MMVSGSRLRSLPLAFLWSRVYTYAYEHIHICMDFTRARVFVHTGAPMVSRRCINCKIEISASTIITIVNAPTLLLVRYRIQSGSHRTYFKSSMVKLNY